MRDELEQLLDDDDDMADLYLTRKLEEVSSPISGSGAALATKGSKVCRTSRASMASVRGDDNDVEELEMLLEVVILFSIYHRNRKINIEAFIYLLMKTCVVIVLSGICRLIICKLMAH